jgi:uncharacterized protein YydD (DUF2326 family)
MRLLRLSANQPSFKTIIFNPTGLSIIVGKKTVSAAQNKKGTTNGVGKSLAVALVHFCLGANEKKGMTKHLPGWSFTLDFEIGDEKFTAVRTTHEPSKIMLNGSIQSLDAFRTLMGKKVFDLQDDISFLSFRPLISRFIRPGKDSYNDYHKPVPKEQPYAQQLCTAYLLGLDAHLAEAKFRLRKDLEDVIKLAKNLSRDAVLKQFFTEGKKVEFESVNLNRTISEKEKKLAAFKVAEDFDAMKLDADRLSEELRGLRNRRVMLENAIKNIDKSLQMQPDISSEELLAFYEKAKVQLTELVVKEVREIESFNQKLIADRLRRLESERRTLRTELEPLKIKIATLGKLEDEKLKLLASTGALDDYRVLTNELASLRARLDKLESFKRLTVEYKIKQLEIEKQLNEENQETINYLDRSRKGIIDKHIAVFQELAKRFYEAKRAGIEIENNDGDNQLRYRINAEIDSDTSDGINQVKLFCFDFTILKNRFGHSVDTLFHDGRLLDPMDARQRAAVFNIAHEETRQNSFQYIISANEDVLDSMREIFDDTDFEEIITKNIILELTDESDRSKLLGITVEKMNYEGD